MWLHAQETGRTHACTRMQMHACTLTGVDSGNTRKRPYKSILTWGGRGKVLGRSLFNDWGPWEP